MWMTVTLVKVGEDVRSTSPIVGVNYDITTRNFFGDVTMVKCWQINHGKVYALLTSDIMCQAKKAVIYFNANDLQSIVDINFWLIEFERYNMKPDILLYGTLKDGESLHADAICMAETYADRARRRGQLGNIFVSTETQNKFEDMYTHLIWDRPHH